MSYSIEDLPEDFDVTQFRMLAKSELEKVPFNIVRWQCKVKLCKRFTRMRDYSLKDHTGEWYYHTRLGWINIRSTFFMCGKHYKRYGKLALRDIPLKKVESGEILDGYDDTGKEMIIY